MGVGMSTGDLTPPGTSPLLPSSVTRAFIAIVVVAFLVLAVLGFYINENRTLAREGRDAKKALCSFRADLQGRHDQTQIFLDEHEGEDPIHAFGLTLPRAQLESQVKTQQATLDSLTIKC